MKYPDYFPSNCPPVEACAKEVPAYRMCKTNCITRSDFQSYYEMGKNFGGKINGYGVSVLSDELEELGKSIGVQIKLQREEIFEKMQRI